jgi:hypothetical protein
MSCGGAGDGFTVRGIGVFLREGTIENVVMGICGYRSLNLTDFARFFGGGSAAAASTFLFLMITTCETRNRGWS